QGAAPGDLRAEGRYAEGVLPDLADRNGQAGSGSHPAEGLHHQGRAVHDVHRPAAEGVRPSHAPKRYFTTPATSTVSARPRTCHPANGLLRLLERNFAGSMVQAASGSMIVTSAMAPDRRVPRSMPRTRAGLTVIFSMTCGQVRMPGSISALMQTGRNVS